MEKLPADWIQRFLENRCSPEEARRVSEYFGKYPEQLERFFSIKEWDEVPDDFPLDPDVSGRLLDAVRGKALTLRKDNRLHWRTWVSIAAMLVVSAMVAWLVWPARHAKNTATTAAHAGEPMREPEPTVHRNQTGEIIAIRLEDGSSVNLYPASEISYKAHFEVDSRQIDLKGEAEFNVAPDKQRPFTVFAGETATTALGTIFRVANVVEAAYTDVQLIEGKIRVLANRYADLDVQQAFFPEPGERVSINRATKFAKLVKPAPLPSDKPTKPMARTQSWAIDDSTVTFTNTPVAQIVELLEKQQQLSVSYSKGLLDNMFFTGSFKRHDQLTEEVIRTIAILNQLKVERTATGFILSK